MSLNLTVVQGQLRRPVGTIEARPGLVTNKGEITRVTSQTVFIGEKAYRDLSQLTVRRSHAASSKEGYRDYHGYTIRYARVSS